MGYIYGQGMLAELEGVIENFFCKFELGHLGLSELSNEFYYN